MSVSDIGPRAPLVYAILAMLAGCGGLQAQYGPPGTMAAASRSPQRNDVIIRHPSRQTSWMSPEAKSANLLYISNLHTVTVYSYPAGKLVGTLTGFDKSYGECVDTAGDVYITDSLSLIYEYAHGATKPLRILRDKQYIPEGCAVDSTTGDLAVANYSNANGQEGNVIVYHRAKGAPRSYVSPTLYYYYFCGYDDSGNLYVDGQNDTGFGFDFAVLRKGGQTLRDILLDQSIAAPGGVQWDGRYIAVGDQAGQAIYQFIKGSRGTLAGTTPLNNTSGNVFQFAISGSTVVVPVFFTSSIDGLVQFYNYPAGGTATKTVTSGVYFPADAVISSAPSLRR